MELPRRQFVRLTASAATVPALPRVASALDYPTRPVRIIDGFPPGGASDIVARLTAQWLLRRLRQEFIVENRQGASSNIAAEEVVQAHADGYTLLLVTATNAMSATLYDHLSFNFIRDVAPVAGVVRVPNVMVINPSVPADTVPAFIAYANIRRRRNPGPCCGRTVQGDGRRQFGSRAIRRQFGSRAIPRRCACPR
jgi:tripartite-type tricarboxylate transporter receptor subunit TctC